MFWEGTGGLEDISARGTLVGGVIATTKMGMFRQLTRGPGVADTG